MQRFINLIRPWYQKRLMRDLNKYGLRYDDLLIETEPDVIKAIARLSPREKALRQMRLKRALDIELKGTEMPKRLWDTQGDHLYLRPLIEQARAERYAKELIP